MHKTSIRLKFSAGFYLFCAVVLLMFPLKWIAAWITAMCLHEFFHYFALQLFGVRVRQVSIGYNGARMQTEPLSNIQETACALAGPIGGLILLIFVRRFPLLAICGFLQSAYNLLPIYPLDGGRALLSLLRMFFDEIVAERIYRVFSKLIILLLMIIAVFSAFVGFGFMPIILMLSIIIKSTCKHGVKIVK